jgi:hypothetical protein
VCGMVWYGGVCYSMVWYGMVWFGMVWYGVMLFGLVWYGCGWGGGRVGEWVRYAPRDEGVRVRVRVRVRRE